LHMEDNQRLLSQPSKSNRKLYFAFLAIAALACIVVVSLADIPQFQKNSKTRHHEKHRHECRDHVPRRMLEIYEIFAESFADRDFETLATSYSEDAVVFAEGQFLDRVGLQQALAEFAAMGVERIENIHATCVVKAGHGVFYELGLYEVMGQDTSYYAEWEEDEAGRLVMSLDISDTFVQLAEDTAAVTSFNEVGSAVADRIQEFTTLYNAQDFKALTKFFTDEARVVVATEHANQLYSAADVKEMMQGAYEQGVVEVEVTIVTLREVNDEEVLVVVQAEWGAEKSPALFKWVLDEEEWKIDVYIVQ